MPAARKHLPLRIVLSVLPLALIVACSGGGAGGDGGSTITLRVQQSLNTDEGHAKFEDLTEAFEAENPNIDVEVSVVPWDSLIQVTRGKIAAGNSPDVIMGNSSQGTGVLSSQGQFLDLTEYLNANSELQQDFPDGALTEFGAPIGLPFTIAQEGIIFYRPKMFAEAGVTAPPPNEAWTWEQFRAAAKKLTNEEKDQYAFGERGKSGIAAMKAYIPYGFSFGTDIIEKEGEDWVSALGTDDSMRTGLTTQLSLNEVRPRSYLAWQTPEAERAWNQHQIAMLNIGAWFSGLPDFKGEFGKDYDVMLFPTDDPANRSVYTAYNYWHVMKASEHQEAALDFLTFLFQPENLQSLAEANKNTIPATISGQEFDHYNSENYPLWAERLSDWQQFARFTPSYPEYQALWVTAVSPVMEAIANGDQAADEGFDAMDSAINKDLESQD